MKLLAVIRLAHETIVKSLGFFLVNALILAGLIALGLGLVYFSLASSPTLVISLLYPFLALLFYMYVASTQGQYYGPRVRREEALPSSTAAWSEAKKNWPPLAVMAVILMAIAFFLLNLPGLWTALYIKVKPLRSPAILSFDQLKHIPLTEITQPRNLIFLIYYLASFLLIFLCLPLFALGFTTVYQKEEGIKTAVKKVRSYFKAKPCSSILLYLFSLVIIILLPYRLLNLQGPRSIPGIDVVFLGLQLFISLILLVYGLLMALVSQMVLQEMTLQESSP